VYKGLRLSSFLSAFNFSKEETATDRISRNFKCFFIQGIKICSAAFMLFLTKEVFLTNRTENQMKHIGLFISPCKNKP
jgi:hypothetical protein